MADKTSSGATAIGDPMSKARIISEAEHYLEQAADILPRTEEGQYLISAFENDTDSYPGEVFYSSRLDAFIAGVLFGSKIR